MSRSPEPLPDALVELASQQAGYVASRQGAGLGLHRNRLAEWARSGLLRPVLRGVYDVLGALPPPASRGGRLELRRRRAAVLGLLAYGPRALATGLCALVLAGVEGAPADLVPEVTFRHGDPRRPIPGIRIRRVAVRHWILIDGFALLEPEHALAQAVPEVDRLTAVCLMDSALNRNLITARGLQRAHDLARGHPGVAGTHRWWVQADRRADSPAETVARLRCSDAGYPPDALQLAILDGSGRALARVELAWLLPDGRWLLAEVDGIEVHGTAQGVIADLHRQNPLITSSTLLRRYTGADALSGRLTAEVGSILRTAGWRAGAATPTGPLVLRAAA